MSDRHSPIENENAEVAVLGAMLQDPTRSIPIVRGMLKPDDFYNAKIAEVIRAVFRIAEAGDELRIDLLLAKLRALGDDAPEESWLLSLADSNTRMFSSVLVDNDCDRVLKAATLRRLELQGESMMHEARKAHEADGDPAKILAVAGRDLSLIEKRLLVLNGDEGGDDDVARQAPYPVDALPEAVAAYVLEHARAKHVDPSAVATMMLPCLGAAIGNARWLHFRDDWQAPAMPWACLVIPSGSVKSPVFRTARKGIDHIEKPMRLAYREAADQYKADHAAWKRAKPADRGDEPTMPTRERIKVKDTGIEKLGMLLQDNRRGMLATVDELSGWMVSFDRYQTGGARERWLEMYDGDELSDDRVGRPGVDVQAPFVGIMGTTQPERLREVLRGSMVSCGLAARFLFCMPRPRPKIVSRVDPDRDVEAAAMALFDRLRAIPMRLDDFGDPTREAVYLSDDAADRFVGWANTEHNPEALLLPDGGLREAWPKLEGAVLRIALILHCCDEPESNVCSVATLERAIRIVEWHKAEAKRVYAMLGGDDRVLDTDAEALIAWTRARGGDVAVRDLQRGGPKAIRKADRLEAMLKRIERAGRGEVYFGGERGTEKRFRLLGDTPGDSIPAGDAENRHSVAVAPVAPAIRREAI